jgi:hypothetical protein
MIGALVKILSGPIVDSITKVWVTKINKEVTEQELRAEVTQAVVEAIGGVSEHQASVLVAEAKGESWLQRNWRPMTGAALGFTVLFWAVIVPIAVDWLGFPEIRIGDLLLEWVFTGLLAFGSVYAGGRTLEKIADKITTRLG